MSGAGLIPTWQVLRGSSGKDITKELGDSWKEVIHETVIGGKACTLTMRFADPKLDMADGPPTQGSTVSVNIGYQGKPLYYCGTFEVDEYMLEGPPFIFTVKCVEAGVRYGLRTLNSVAYEGKTLVQIAQEVAARHGFSVDASQVTPNVQYERITQNQEPDLAFLHRIANQHGYDFNVRNNVVVFYSRNKMEAQKPIGTISAASSDVKHFRLKNQTIGHRTYKASTVTYFDPTTKKTWTQTYSDPNIRSGDTLKAQERLENNQQAAVKSAAYMHAHNMLAFQGEIEMIGSPQYVAGVVVALDGFGFFDRYNWVVEKARHIMNRQGFITRLYVRTALNAQNQLVPVTPHYFSAPIGAPVG